jgi:hypothetical protein
MQQPPALTRAGCSEALPRPTMVSPAGHCRQVLPELVTAEDGSRLSLVRIRDGNRGTANFEGKHRSSSVISS